MEGLYYKEYFVSMTIKTFDHHFIPASQFRKGSKSPYLMVVLHGRSDCLDSFEDIDQELKIPGMNYLLINAPKKYLDGYSWYAHPPKQASGILRSRMMLFALLEELEEQGWKPGL
jgi:phospholipase/carboxylesterase